MDVHATVKSSYVALQRAIADSRLRDCKWFLEQEVDTWNHWISLSWRCRLWLWRHGFTSPCGKLYDFDAYGQAAYLSELQRYRLYDEYNGRHRYLLDDKLSQHWMLSIRPENRPKALGFLDGGYVHGVAGTTFDGDPTPVSEWLPRRLRAESRLVLKQVRGLGGQEVHVCEFEDGYRLDGDPVSETGLCAPLADLENYLVTAFVEQHDYADRLYPNATNTIRLYTVWDEATGQLHVPMAIHRIGTDRSRPIDNWSAGGLSAEIDVERGRLGPATRKPTSSAVSWYDTHPDTEAPIAGSTIPKWERVRSTVEEIAGANTNIPIIGWDVVLDTSGNPVVLEANTGSDVDLMQVHRPLLADPRFATAAARYLDGVEAPRSSP